MEASGFCLPENGGYGGILSRPGTARRRPIRTSVKQQNHFPYSGKRPLYQRGKAKKEALDEAGRWRVQTTAERKELAPGGVFRGAGLHRRGGVGRPDRGGTRGARSRGLRVGGAKGARRWGLRRGKEEGARSQAFRGGGAAESTGRGGAKRAHGRGLSMIRGGKSSRVRSSKRRGRTPRSRRGRKRWVRAAR